MGQKEEKEKIKTARETLGRYFYDLSKTSFGTGLLGTFLPYFTKDESAMTETVFTKARSFFQHFPVDCLIEKEKILIKF